MQVFQEKPLNMAHFCERKADQFLLNGDVASAAQCYKDASNHIEKAMEASYSINCLPVLQTQYDFYVAQSQLKEKKIDQPKCDFENKDIERLKGGDMPKSKLVSEDLPDGALVEKENTTMHHPPSKDIRMRMSALDREPDSLLQFLDNDHREENKCHKLPKVDRDVIEELKVRNQHLQDFVNSFIEKNGKLETENRSLKEERESLQVKVKVLESQLVNRSGATGNTTSKPREVLDSFTVPEFTHAGEFAQPQSFFHFDCEDPVTVYQLNKAMEEDTDMAEIQQTLRNSLSKPVESDRSLTSTNQALLPLNCSSTREETSSTIIASICYQEVDDA